MTPGISSTMEIRSPAIRLNIVDLPTFGRPTIATVGNAINFLLYVTVLVHLLSTHLLV